jgi:hypothetical protein
LPAAPASPELTAAEKAKADLEARRESGRIRLEALKERERADIAAFEAAKLQWEAMSAEQAAALCAEGLRAWPDPVGIQKTTFEHQGRGKNDLRTKSSISVTVDYWDRSGKISISGLDAHPERLADNDNYTVSTSLAPLTIRVRKYAPARATYLPAGSTSCLTTSFYVSNVNGQVRCEGLPPKRTVTEDNCYPLD